jgi:membrane associated rhomboid family serine protease
LIFALPLYDDNPVRETPVVTYVLIGMCIGAFLWELGHNADVVTFQYGMIPAVVFGYAELPPRLAAIPPWATIFTSMFLHGGWFHLGGNMLFLWIFGNNVEDLLGHARYLLLYLASGAAAALIQAAADPISNVPMIGASGAIAGVLGAYAWLFPRARVLTLIFIIFFVTVVEIPALILLALWFILQFVPALGQVAVSSGGGQGVAYFAHVGGFVFGSAVAGAMLYARRRRRIEPRLPGY